MLSGNLHKTTSSHVYELFSIAQFLDCFSLNSIPLLFYYRSQCLPIPLDRFVLWVSLVRRWSEFRGFSSSESDRSVERVVGGGRGGSSEEPLQVSEEESDEDEEEVSSRPVDQKRPGSDQIRRIFHEAKCQRRL